MAIPVANVNIATDTWENFIDDFNGVAFLMSTQVVTANSSANGASTTGSAYISGNLSANVIATNTIRSGNVQSVGNTLFSLSPIQIVNAHFSSNTFVTSNTNANQVVDSFDITVYRTAKYVIEVSTPAVGYQATEILALHDGVTTLSTEYAVLFSNTLLGTFSTAISGNNFNLQFSPVNANNTVNVTRTLMLV